MKVNRNNMQTPATTTVERPVPGVYPVVITDVKDFPGESHLKIWYDFVDSPFKGYFSRLRAEHPDWDWLGMYRKYYTPAAVWAFDRLCNAVSRSNGNFAFDGDKINADERTLIGKKMGLVLRGREYYTNSGDLRIKLEVFKEVPLDRIPYESVPKVLTIAEQEAREARKKGTPAPAPAAYAQPAQAAPAQAPAYQQPVQTVARQTAATPAYAQTQQAYAANPALAQFVDVSGDTEMMPFM